MRNIALALSLVLPVLADQPTVSFAPLKEDGERITAATVTIAPGRVATIAVVDADSAKAQLGTGGDGAPLPLLIHDPVSRLTILTLPEGAPSGTVLKRGTALGLKAGDALYLDPANKDSPSRLVKWETEHREKVLPLALMRVHHPGEAPPLPGSPLYNGEGEFVAICHEAAGEFGNGTYALPVEVVARAEKDQKTRGQVARCWIGITMEAKNPVPFVESVRPESPAARGGMKKGDILLSIGAREVNTYADAVNAFYYLVSGEAIPVNLLRGTEKLSFDVVPEVHPAVQEQLPPKEEE